MALNSLVAMMLTYSAACVAGDTSTTVAPVVPTSESAVESPAPQVNVRPGRHGPARHLTVAQSIEESVRRLTRGLDLDPGQQARLRQILVDQRRQVLQLRSSSAPDVAGTTLAIYGQTKARIRAMLNDEQRSKYSADVPRDTLAPAQADLQHWMKMQESKRQQDSGDSQ
jgi:hypothetical protein